ncbi:MAG: hypothetical protein WCO35_02935 [Candidatus Nomurabacteria bacterium]
MFNKNFKNVKENLEDGYILAFALIITAVLLTISFSASRIITKEIYFSRLIENGKVAYYAADAGVECAQYLDTDFRDNTLGISLVLNSTSSYSGTNPGQLDFESNARDNVFFSTSTIYDYNGNFPSALGVRNLDKISCASDGTYNNIFASSNYSSSTDGVLNNLNNGISSYNIVGDAGSATTTFGIVLQQTDPIDNTKIIQRCVLVEFAKTMSIATGAVASTTGNFSIISTGYSSCNASDQSRVSRTIYRYSNE